MVNKSEEPERHSGAAIQNNTEIETDREALNDHLWSGETPESKAFFLIELNEALG